MSSHRNWFFLDLTFDSSVRQGIIQCASPRSFTDVSDTEPTLAIAAPQLWRRLERIEPFPHFNEDQKTAFLQAYERRQGIDLKVFSKGDLVCKKGEYELDLCFILNGSADLYDDVAGKGYLKVASLPAGTFYGELG